MEFIRLALLRMGAGEYARYLSTLQRQFAANARVTTYYFPKGKTSVEVAICQSW